MLGVCGHSSLTYLLTPTCVLKGAEADGRVGQKIQEYLVFFFFTRSHPQRLYHSGIEVDVNNFVLLRPTNQDGYIRGIRFRSKELFFMCVVFMPSKPGRLYHEPVWPSGKALGW